MAVKAAAVFPRPQPRVTGYAIAILGAIMAGTSHWWLAPLLEDTPPVRLLLVCGVTLAGWIGGLGPSLLGTALGLAVIFVDNDLPGNTAALTTRLLRFGSLALVISFLSGALHRTRRRAELKQKEFDRSEGKYRRLVETAGEGICVIDKQGRITYANPRLAEMLGKPPLALVGLTFDEFLADPREAPANWAEPPRGRLSWHELRLRAALGHVRQTIVTARPLGPDEVSADDPVAAPDGVCGFLLMVTDVTPLKRTEEALREKERVLRSFYDSSVMAMGVVELTEDDARFISANTLADKYFGLEPGRLEGKTGTYIKAPEEMLTTWLARFRECQETGRPVRFEYQGTCASSPAWVAASLSPMGPPGAARACCSFIVEDITERKRTEEDLRKAKELAEAVSRRRTGSSPSSATSCAPRLRPR